MYTFLLSKIEVGSHLYVNITDSLHFHAETVTVTALVVAAISLLLISGTSNLQKVPGTLQNVLEIVFDLVKSLAVTQIGPSYYSQFLPFIATIFLFILGSNWAGALIPWKLIELPEGELAAPTNDINTTISLALATSITYFYAGFKKKGLGYFKKYLQPTPVLLPINVLEDFTKPLSLSFRLFGNILADELTVSVLTLLVPILIPLPIMILGLFASTIQALIFSTLAAAYIGESLEGHH